MTTIGFIGLGIMGGPMAKNLVKAGYDVVGYNRTTSKVDDLVANGGRAAESAIEAVRGADVVVTMLPDSPDVRQVLLGDDETEGVLANIKEGALLIDFSSIRPDVSREIAEAAEHKGVRPLDAPVSGGEAGAIEGSLSIMVGGAAAAFADAERIFDAVGGTVVHVGPAGSGQTVKLANQLIVAGNIQLVAESIVLLEAHGVDTAAAIKVLAGGLAGSTVLNRKAEAMVNRDFKPGFRAELHHKDLGNVQAAARDAGVAIPLGALAAQLMGSLKAQGNGGLDHGALLTIVEQLSGRS